MNRSEVEVLLRLRAEGAQSLDLFNGTLDKVGKGGTAAAGGLDSVARSAKGVGVASIAAGSALGLLADRAINALIGGFSKSVQAATGLEAAMAGLSSVAAATGESVDAANRAAQSLAADGLLSVSDAAAGLKNLLSKGLNLEQSVEVMNRLKDSAAFGKQGMLDFSDAVRGATEGIRNGNSAMSDNAGVATNLSQIYKRAGLEVEDLGGKFKDYGEAQKFVNQFQKETINQLGDTERLLDSAAGAQAKMSAAADRAAASIGGYLTPAVAAANNAAAGLLGVVEGYPVPFIAAGTAVAALGVKIAATKAIAMLGIPGLSGFGGAASSLSGVLLSPAGLIAAIGGLAVAFTYLKTSQLKEDADNIERATQIMGKAVMNATQATSIIKAYQAGLAGQKLETKAFEVVTLDLAAAWQKGAGSAGKLGDAAMDAGIKIKGFGDNTRNAAGLASYLELAQQKVKTELASTGLTVGQLTIALQQSEAGFKKWADDNKLSAETVKFLEDRIKSQTEAQKKSREEREKATAEIERQRDALEQLGIVTGATVAKGLKEFATLEARARTEGADWRQVLAALLPQLEELHANAVRSGQGIDETSAALKRAKAASQELSAEFLKGFGVPAIVQGLDVIPGKLVRVASAGEVLAQNVTDSFAYFGIKTRAELEATAHAAVVHFNTIRTSGTATPEQIRIAHEQMVEAVKAASGQLPTFWEKEVAPRVKATVADMGKAISDNFAQMLLGGKGLGEGFRDIWTSIKNSAISTFNEILSAFINGLLKRMLGALLGQQAGFASGWKGLFGGLLGGGGGGIPGIGGLFGGGTAIGGAGLDVAGMIPGVTGGLDMAGTGGGLFGAGGLGSWATGGIGSSVIGGGVGLGVGFGLGNRFGTGAGILGGAGSGALTGLMLGGPIGMGIGALAGLVGGWIGGARNNTKDQREQFATQSLGLSGGTNELWSVLQERLPPELADSLKNRALNVIGKKDTAANEEWMRDVIAALDKFKGKYSDTSSAASQADAQRVKDLANVSRAILEVDDEQERLQASLQGASAIEQREIRSQIAALAVKRQELEAQRGAYEQNATAAESASARETAAREKQIDSIKKQLADLDTEFNGLFESWSAEDAAPEFDEFGNRVYGVIELQQRARLDSIEKQREALRQQLEDEEAAKDAAAEEDRTRAGSLRADLEKILGDPITIPVGFDVDDLPTPTHHGGGYTPSPDDQHTLDDGGVRIGGAAEGIFAARPTLAVFGEGGEPELGGPVSFMTKALIGALSQLAPSRAPAQAEAVSPEVNVTVNIPADAFRQSFRDGASMVVRAINDNHQGTRTALQRRGRTLGSM